jgi:hypothetical protein
MNTPTPPNFPKDLNTGVALEQNPHAYDPSPDDAELGQTDSLLTPHPDVTPVYLTDDQRDFSKDNSATDPYRVFEDES